MFAVLCVLCLVVQSTLACTGFYVGKKVSADGSTLIGRTVDTPSWTACFRSLKVPRGEGVRYAYVCTPSVTACDKDFFASGCANEKGLIAGNAATAADTFPSDAEGRMKDYETQIDYFLSLPHCAGWCIVQLYDVEQEQNGVYDYWRKPKMDIPRAKRIFSKDKYAK